MASSGIEDLPNNSCMRDRGELDESPMETARRTDVSAVAGARAGEEATVRAEDKRGRRPSRRHHASQQLRDGFALEQQIHGTLPVEQQREKHARGAHPAEPRAVRGGRGAGSDRRADRDQSRLGRVLGRDRLGRARRLGTADTDARAARQGKRDSAVADLSRGRRLPAQLRRRGELGDRCRRPASRVLDRPVRRPPPTVRGHRGDGRLLPCTACADRWPGIPRRPNTARRCCSLRWARSSASPLSGWSPRCAIRPTRPSIASRRSSKSQR